MILTPNLYSTGKWEVKEPFDSLLTPEATYVCEGVRSFSDLAMKKIDVFSTYYEPNGLSENDYLNDKNLYASIVTLTSKSAPTIFIPDTYILSMPDKTSIPYNHTVLSISLGAVADTLVLDDIEDKIEQLVLSDLGIESSVKTHVSGETPEYMTLQEHMAIESNRRSVLENNTSLYSQLEEKNKIVQELTEKNSLLEEYINQNI